MVVTYFSIQAAIAAPGGITSDLKIWLDADKGITSTPAISKWDDQSTNAKHVTQGTPSNQPSLNIASAAMNFHRSVEFDGDKDFLKSSTGILDSSLNNMSFFIVTDINQSSGSNNQLFGMGNGFDSPHVGFKSSGQVSYSGKVAFLPSFWNFSSSELMPFNQSLIYSGAIDYSLATARAYNYVNGLKNSTVPTSLLNTTHGGATNFAIGGDDSSHDFDGSISEFLLYKSILTSNQRQRVETYLAIKYGQTLNNNYLRSNSDSIYTLDGQYDFGIFGLAKDPAADLDQRISRSINDSSGLILSTDNDFTSANSLHGDTFTDGDHLLMGHDNNSTSATQTSELSSIFDKRIIREWKVQNTASTAAINLQFSTLPALTAQESYVLISNSDGNFSSGNNILAYSNNKTFLTVNFPLATSYFSIAIITNKVEFSQASATDSENIGGNLPTVSVFGLLPSPIAVPLLITGTATDSVDFATPSLSIPAGGYDGIVSSNISLANLSISDDILAELDETIILTLDTSGITNLTTGDVDHNTVTHSATTYTIIDNDISVDATGSSLIVTDSSAEADGIDTTSLNLQLKELDGDNISLVGVQVTFSIGSGTATFANNLTTYTSSTNVSGIVSAFVKSSTVGSVTIIATVDRDNDGGTTPEENIVNGSPANISFLAKPVSGITSTISVSTNNVSTDGGSSTITVQAKDVDGTVLTGNSGIVTLASNSTDAVLSAVSYIGAGIYTATISNTKAELVAISGTIDGNTITSGNPSITFTIGAASGANTSMVATNNILRANGLDTTSISIQATDAQGNLLISGGDTVTLNAPGSALTISVMDNNNGLYTANITNTVAETITITGQINSSTLANSLSINFIDYGIAQINATDGQFINGIAPLGSTVTVRDSNNTLLCNTTAGIPSGYFHCIITLEVSDGERLTVTTTDLAGNNESSSIAVLKQDSDNDGISDVIESYLANNGGDTDTLLTTDNDSDSLPDFAEVILGSNPKSLNSPIVSGNLDSNSDGIADSLEFFFFTLGGSLDTKLATDTDSDGLPDFTELATANAKFYNANYPTINGAADDDSNNLTNAVEAFALLKSINNLTLTSDYDNDGYSDALEIRLASNLLFANEKDFDNDGINDAIEAFLTGTINDSSNTALNDRDSDGLADIFELNALTDLSDMSADINSSNDADADNDGITDAVELYLYANTRDANISSDQDSDGITDIIEVSLGSNAFIPSAPPLWLDLKQITSDTVEIKANIAGFQSPAPILSWELSDILEKQPDAIISYPNERTLHISGLGPEIYNIELSGSHGYNAVALDSLIRYSFKLTTDIIKDNDFDGIANSRDEFNALTGQEELLHTNLLDPSRYAIQAQYGQIVRLGSIARLANNNVANITSLQIKETVELGYPITPFSPSSVEDIDSSSNIFDIEIVNLPSLASNTHIVIPLHHPVPANPLLLSFDIESSLWTFFDSSAQDNYFSALGTPGTCPGVGNAEYVQGLIAGHNCIQVQITEGGSNDNDNLVNGAISHLISIGSGSAFPDSENSINNPIIEDTNNTGNSTFPVTDNTQLANTTSAQNNDNQSSSGGSLNHYLLALLSIMALFFSSISKASPQGGSIKLGQGTIDNTISKQTLITQNSNRLAIDWQSFDIAGDEVVTFVQPDSSALVLNRDFSGSASQIFGSIRANGQVLLLNSAGILIGETASVRVGSFLASDLSTEIADFSQGDFTLSDAQKDLGGITNLGNIQSTSRNGIYIAGQFINNSGEISSSNGDIHLAIADEMIVSISDNGQLGIQLTTPLTSDISDNGNLIYNDGNIVSFNGNIYLDLFYSDTIKANTVNNQGIIQAIEITEGNGQIYLTATPTTLSPDNITEVDSIISDSLVPASNNSIVEITLKSQPKVSMNTIMPECDDNNSTSERSDCNKYLAIKRYLGRLLLGGELPE